MIWFGCRFGWTMMDISLDVGRKIAGLDMWLCFHLVGSEIWFGYNWDGELCELDWGFGWVGDSILLEVADLMYFWLGCRFAWDGLGLRFCLILLSWA